MSDLEVVIRKPLHDNFVAIREKVLTQAKIQHRQIKVILPQGNALIDPLAWIHSGKRIEKVFRVQHKPMVLWANYVPLKSNEANRPANPGSQKTLPRTA